MYGMAHIIKTSGQIIRTHNLGLQYIFKNSYKPYSMAKYLDDSQLLDYFEKIVKDFIVETISNTNNWWAEYIPQQIREEASQRYQRSKKISNVLNKEDYEIIHYINFDSYEKIISRKDNWRKHFEDIFVEKGIFEYKMQIILSLRNDIRHGRSLNVINKIRLRLHCYDIISQIFEAKDSDGQNFRKELMQKLGFGEDW